MIRYQQGNVLLCKEDVLMHGVNCRRMGAGVALTISNRWPIVKEMYLGKGTWYTGQTQWVKVGGRIIRDTVNSTPQITRPIYVVNAATQEYYGRTGCYVDYEAVRQVFTSVIFQCQENDWTLAAPKIGAGLAGGDWSRIERIINEVSGDFVVNIYVLRTDRS